MPMLECSRVIEGDISKVGDLHVRSAGQRPAEDNQSGQAATRKNVSLDEIY